jgi:hypothetical protein
MALPKATQKQIEEAERLHAEAYGTEEKADDRPTAEQDTAAASEQGKGDDSKAQSASTEGTDAKATLSEVPQDTAGSEDAGASGDGAVSKESDPEHWKHKYNVLKGKYDKEVPRLQEENAIIRGQVTELQRHMQDVINAKPQPENENQAAKQPLITAEELEDYGSEMIDVVKRAAREEFEPVIAQLREENANLRGLLGGVQQQTTVNARQAMLDTLDEQISNWRELNSNPEFLGWLENVDPYSGEKKLDLLRTAFEGNNTARVSAFFKGFLNENAAFTSSQQPVETKPQVSLETLVAPGRAADGDEPRAQEGNVNGKVWTDSEIKTFYRDVQRGVYQNDPVEKERLERDIFLAQQQGRISP